MTPPTHTEERKQLHQFWKDHIENWKESKTNQRQYCRQHNLIPHRFTYWKHKFESSTELTLVPIQISEPLMQQSQTLQLSIHDKFTIKIPDQFNPVTLEKVIRLIEAI